MAEEHSIIELTVPPELDGERFVAFVRVVVKSARHETVQWIGGPRLSGHEEARRIDLRTIGVHVRRIREDVVRLSIAVDEHQRRARLGVGRDVRE